MNKGQKVWYNDIEYEITNVTGDKADIVPVAEAHQGHKIFNIAISKLKEK